MEERKKKKKEKRSAVTTADGAIGNFKSWSWWGCKIFSVQSCRTLYRPGTFYILLLMLPPYISSRMLSALFFVFMVPVIVIPASAFYAV